MTAQVDTHGVKAAPAGLRRWAYVFAAAMFINTSYGTMSYAFSVLLTPGAAGGTFGTQAVSLGFGLALLVSGLAAVGAGTVADLWGTRKLMAGGSVVGAGGLALLSLCTEAWQAVVVLAVVIGPAMSATFYEPVYVLMNRWFPALERPRAYGVLTLLSGFSITIYTPLTQWWVGAFGWERAVLLLAGCLLVVGLLVPLLVEEPRDAGEVRSRTTPRGFVRETWVGMRQGDARFWAFTAAFFAGTTALSGYSFHMIAQLGTRGFEASAVANTIALTGVVSLPARLLLPAMSGRVPGTVLLGVCLLLLAVAAGIASAAGAWWQVWLYVAVFGAVFGAVYPLRALAVSERFAGPYFGRLIGVQALFIAVARALGPAVIGVYADDRASYEVAFRVAGVVLALAAVATLVIMRRRQQGLAVEVAGGGG